MAKNATITKFHGISKAGKDFDAYKVTAGHFSALIFPRSQIDRDYLDQYLEKGAHEEFAQDGDNLFD